MFRSSNTVTYSEDRQPGKSRGPLVPEAPVLTVDSGCRRNEIRRRAYTLKRYVGVRRHSEVSDLKVVGASASSRLQRSKGTARRFHRSSATACLSARRAVRNAKCRVPF
jgi:hypothetical protein